jgi:hypothetical protein
MAGAKSSMLTKHSSTAVTVPNANALATNVFDVLDNRLVQASSRARLRLGKSGGRGESCARP